MIEKTEFAATLDDVRGTLEYQAEMQFLAITEEICAAMEMRGLSRSQLAAAMGVRPSYVTKLLSGKENMTLLTLIKISRAVDANLTIAFRRFLGDGSFSGRENVALGSDKEGGFAGALAA